MEFKPLTEAEIKQLNLIEPGIYRFQVLRTDQKTSRNGKDYFNLKIRLYVGNGEKFIYDMLFFEGKMIYKTKHFCEAVGLKANYEAGKLMPYECDGKEGEVEVIQRLNKMNNEYESVIKDYIVKEEYINDPIPF